MKIIRIRGEKKQGKMINRFVGWEWKDRCLSLHVAIFYILLLCFLVTTNTIYFLSTTHTYPPTNHCRIIYLQDNKTFHKIFSYVVATLVKLNLKVVRKFQFVFFAKSTFHFLKLTRFQTKLIIPLHKTKTKTVGDNGRALFSHFNSI